MPVTRSLVSNKILKYKVVFLGLDSSDLVLSTCIPTYGRVAQFDIGIAMGRVQ